MKSSKSFFALFLSIFLIVSLCACNNDKNENTSIKNTQNDQNSQQSDSIEIGNIDIDWNIDEGIIEGERQALLHYTNNSEYTISGFELTFKEQQGITDEKKEKFLTDIKEKLEFSDEEIAELKKEDISIHAKTEKLVEPGESVKIASCFYYEDDGYSYVKDIEHYNLVEPDIATIRYINHDKIYTTYYDFASEKYSNEEETKVAYQWSKTDINTKIAKPEVKVVEVGIDDESSFSFEAFGMSIDQFSAYVDQCIELGFTLDASSHEEFYTADNTEGYNVYLSYNNEDDMMHANITAPEE